MLAIALFGTTVSGRELLIVAVVVVVIVAAIWFLVRGADVSADRDAMPESAGLLAIADGFALLGLDDQRQLELELPVYDALYAWAQNQVGTI